MDTLVDYNTAKILKDVDFDVPVEYYYNAEGVWSPDPKWDRKLCRNENGKKENFLDYEDCISAPTVSQVIMWLYEKYKVWVYTRPCLSEEGDWVFKGYTKFMLNFKSKEYQTGPRSNPVEAYTAAIQYFLSITNHLNIR